MVRIVLNVRVVLIPRDFLLVSLVIKVVRLVTRQMEDV